MSEQPSDEYKIKPLTIKDESVIHTFLKNFFVPHEPLNKAMIRAGIQREYLAEKHSLNFLSEGLSLACVTSSGEIIGLILNSKMDNHFNEHRNDDSCDPYNVKIIHLLGHFDEQISLARQLDDDIQMDVRMLTVSDKWRNKGIAKKLLKESIKVAKSHGFKHLRSTCTSSYSSKIFLDCGFKVVYSLKYDDCLKDGKIDFLPEKPHTHMNGMFFDL